MFVGSPYKSPIEIDLQLDLINHRWDRAAHAQFMLDESDRVRADFPCMADIRVGPRREERIDVFPAACPGAPILIFVHGGWWRGGTRKEWAAVARGFLERGYAVIISDYALCPKVGIPAITQATRAAVVWAYENAASFNGDRTRLFVAGHSAGGQQAGMMGTTDWTEYDLPADAVTGIVPMSGIFDMRIIRHCWLQPYLQLTGDDARRESPVLNIPSKAPPALILLGDEESEEFHRQSDLFRDAWTAAGHRAEYLAVPHRDHPTSVFMMNDAESRVCKTMAAFFDAC